MLCFAVGGGTCRRSSGARLAASQQNAAQVTAGEQHSPMSDMSAVVVGKNEIVAWIGPATTKWPGDIRSVHNV